MGLPKATGVLINKVEPDSRRPRPSWRRATSSPPSTASRSGAARSRRLVADARGKADVTLWRKGKDRPSR